jgi:hypothetical protein
MPFDLQAIERGYGECDVEWLGNSILVRYRADLNNRALIAMKRVMVGVVSLDGTTRFPDVEAIIDELIRVLLPAGPDVPEDERGWDLTDGGASVPITFDTLVDLPPGLPAAILGAIFRDINDPNRRKPSRNGSPVRASSQPTASPTTTGSSVMLAGPASHPGHLPDSPTPVANGAVGATSFGA